jgi:hypothetical protein
MKFQFQAGKLRWTPARLLTLTGRGEHSTKGPIATQLMESEMYRKCRRVRLSALTPPRSRASASQ